MKKNTIADRIFNFSAGPAVLPVPVLEEARDQLLNYQNSGMSVMEMSHRSKEFDQILAKAEAGVRKNMNIPDNYAVLFLQGGASLQFAMVPMNLCRKESVVDVIHTGVWTKMAITEIKKIANLRLAGSTEQENFRRLPRPDEIKIGKDASYVHIASNNTIYGTQWKKFPETGDIPLVADMSSDILSRNVNITKFGLIFAGAQKNLGPSGVTLVIIRKDLAERADKDMSTMLQYRTHIESGSRYNTPPTFAIYILGLVMDWIGQEGGLVGMEKRNEQKAKLLYDYIDNSGFYRCPVEKSDRSLMNVIIKIGQGNEELEKEFDRDAEKSGLSGLKGHRSVGGLRASIYNAQPMEGVQALIDFMKEFARRKG